jgi:hypothetical protein
MVNQDFTHVVVILDRSGSMESVRNDMEGGFNKFVEDQRKLPGRCTVSLYQFDDEYMEVYSNKDIKEVPPLSLVPRNFTALYDGIGKTFNNVGAVLAALKEEDRPGKVVVVVITDGQENASKEFSRDQIKGMIEVQQSKYSWQVVFMGANFDAYGEGASLGVGVGNILKYAANAVGTQHAYASLSRSVGSYRTGEVKCCSFNDDDKADQENAGA